MRSSLLIEFCIIVVTVTTNSINFALWNSPAPKWLPVIKIRGQSFFCQVRYGILSQYGAPINVVEDGFPD